MDLFFFYISVSGHNYYLHQTPPKTPEVNTRYVNFRKSVEEKKIEMKKEEEDIVISERRRRRKNTHISIKNGYKESKKKSL